MLVVAGQSSPPGQNPMPKSEYRFLRESPGGIEQKINELAAEGWEVTHMEPLASNGAASVTIYVIMRRCAGGPHTAIPFLGGRKRVV